MRNYGLVNANCLMQWQWHSRDRRQTMLRAAADVDDVEVDRRCTKSHEGESIEEVQAMSR